MRTATTRDSADFYFLEVLFDADEQAFLLAATEIFVRRVEASGSASTRESDA
jgi:1,2-phenylacetyl-CoA epoxidase PaaB subunit